VYVCSVNENEMCVYVCSVNKWNVWSADQHSVNIKLLLQLLH